MPSADPTATKLSLARLQQDAELPERERERDPGAPPGLALPTSPWSRHSVPSSMFFLLPWRLWNCLNLSNGLYWAIVVDSEIFDGIPSGIPTCLENLDLVQ